MNIKKEIEDNPLDYSLQIGQKIKNCRINRGITIKDLSAQAQITPSMLSQIERGQANPSLNTIRLLAIALDEPMFSFFVDDANVENEVVRVENRKHIIENGVDYEMLTPDTNGSVELMQINLKPGTSSCERPMGHIGEEVAMVLSGTVELLFEQDSCTLNDGDSVRIKTQIKHAWKNSSDKEVKIIFAVSPPTF